MKKRKSIILTIMALAVIAFSFIVFGQKIQNPPQVQTQTSNQSQTANQNENAKRILEIIEQNGDPVADFFPIQPTDEETKRVRKARTVRFNRKGSVVEPGQKYLTEIGERTPTVAFAIPSFNLPEQLALPVDKSPQIVVGKIITADAFLSDDWTSAYTEFGFNVEQILKDPTKIIPPAPENVTLLRYGAKVKLLASERMIHKGLLGKPLPKLEKRYLLFITYEPSVKAFYIDIAYELRDGKVVPFDGRDIEGNYLARFTSYKQYEDKSESDFIQEVVRAIANASATRTGGKK